jgi:hypothetical protein
MQPVGTAATFQKAGLTYEDHHFKLPDGTYQGSPPKNLTKLYTYLPGSADDENKIPQKAVLRAGINALKTQGHCEGTYTVVTGKTNEGMPVYKHNEQDLYLALMKLKGESCWVVARSLTFETKPQLSLKVAVGEGFPWGASLVWQEWNGRDWQPAPSLRAKPSFHGYGQDGGDGWRTHKEDSYHQAQWDVHKMGRLTGSPTGSGMSSPGKLN